MVAKAAARRAAADAATATVKDIQATDAAAQSEAANCGSKAATAAAAV